MQIQPVQITAVRAYHKAVKARLSAPKKALTRPVPIADKDSEDLRGKVVDVYV